MKLTAKDIHAKDWRDHLAICGALVFLAIAVLAGALLNTPVQGWESYPFVVGLLVWAAVEGARALRSRRHPN